MRRVADYISSQGMQSPLRRLAPPHVSSVVDAPINTIIFQQTLSPIDNSTTGEPGVTRWLVPKFVSCYMIPPRPVFVYFRSLFACFGVHRFPLSPLQSVLGLGHRFTWFPGYSSLTVQSLYTLPGVSLHSACIDGRYNWHRIVPDCQQYLLYKLG